ncbi:MAG: rRNA pseudouridine synthase [Rhodoferax sp.]|nr:rRNA pseudouridine synthase [Rhodoferax sp.]NCP55026.1 rRNA pseudouridine synthase [Rhodoferax sp.]PIW08231.1 MAG: RNA-binding protein [Comamonadaceae bacterium CG17_big_fil_post_rev_8_21_14_2_50_60_13]PIY24343.1 MAG: RNA-binding protein [Comamonadaceae bacterium CG_4_10_14_3_um_filter_60_75]PJC13990.1 MAG: RNA-binding protein [Comamonadaceae bacterium CG_4_9_14_0_8_um_filter_60_18]
MSDTPKSVFRRAAPPAPKAPIPAGQTNTAAYGAGGTLRLNKRMAELGLASRREADDWIAKGWVKVNGRVAEMGMQVAPDVKIEIDKQAQGQQAKQVTVLINKPLGLVSGQAEDGHQPAITLVQPQNRWAEDNARFFFHPSQLKSLVPAGRLDIDSTGLLVLTQDGRVARQLIGEDASMEKEYLVRVVYTGVANPAAADSAAATYAAAPGVRARPAAPTQLSRIDDDDPISQDVQSVFPAEKLALLRHGLKLDGQALQPAQVEWQNPEQLRFVLKEGKKRQIRRMCEQVGLKVVGLKRVRIGRVMLGNLPVGQWRYLAPHEKF